MNVLMQREEEQTPPKEYKIPLVLLGIGGAIYLVGGLIKGGVDGLASMAIAMPITIVVQVVLGLVACFLTAKIMGATFGLVSSAIVKLSAIFVFPAAVASFIPWWIGSLIGLLLYWRLIEYLFELDPIETIVLAIVIWVVNAGAILLSAIIISGLFH